MKHSNLLALVPVLALFAGCAAGSDTVTAELKVANAPVLALKELNTVAEITLTDASASAYTIESVALELGVAGAPSDIVSASVLAGGEVVAEGQVAPGARSCRVTVPCGIEVTTADTTIAFGLKLADAVNMEDKLTIKSVKLKTSKGTVAADCSEAPVLRTAVALRQRYQDGVDNCRIPGLVITNEGTLIAVYDARRDRNRDLQGDIDICFNRSTDGGRTWSDMDVAMDMGEWGGLPQKYNGVSDPCILVDPKTGTIFVSACWMHGVIDEKTGKWVEGLTQESTVWNHQWRTNGSHAGYDVKESSQWMVVRSTDDGLTWSEPENHTREVKPEDYCLMINAPGSGIALSDGTLVFPAQGRRPVDASSFSTLIYSKDGGNSWAAGVPAVNGVHSGECMCVQLSDGSVMLNMRSGKNNGNHEENGRLVSVTSDLGQTWTEHPTSGHVLTEPTCQGTVMSHKYMDRKGEERDLLLFFNPNDPDKRIHHTLKVSLDEGQTWPEQYWLEVDEGRGAGYSCMASLDPDRIGVLYEGSGANLIYQQIRLSEILDF